MEKFRTKAQRIFSFLIMSVLSVWSVVFILSCTPQKSEPPDEKKITIGFEMDSLVEERWTRDRDIFISTARRRGADVIVQIGESSSVNQEAQINFLMEKKIDVLVLIACDSHYLTKTLLDVRRSGIPVLLYERMVYNSGANLLLSFDGETVGELQANAILGKLKQGNVRTPGIILYNGVRGDIYSESVHRGIIKVLSEAIQRGEAFIAADHWSDAASTPEDAFSFINGFLENNPAPEAVIAFSDLQAEAIVRALAINRLAGKVAVAGADADLAACQRIAVGTQTMTVYKPIYTIASTAADLAVYLGRGDRFTIHNAVSDGAFRVPYYKLQPIAVTAETMEETIIKDGFHLREDVYRNMLAP